MMIDTSSTSCSKMPTARIGSEVKMTLQMEINTASYKVCNNKTMRQRNKKESEEKQKEQESKRDGEKERESEKKKKKKRKPKQYDNNTRQ